MSDLEVQQAVAEAAMTCMGAIEKLVSLRLPAQQATDWAKRQ